MKKWTYHHTFGLLICLNAILLAVIGILAITGNSLYLGFAASQELTFFCICAIALISVIWYTVWRCSKGLMLWQKVVRIALVFAVVLLLSSLTLALYLFSHIPSDSRSFSSPDGQHTIVLQTTSVVIREYTTLYEMTSPITMKPVGSYHDDLWLDDVSLLWYEDHFEIIRGNEENLSYPYLP